jgi:hypothetical protein
MNIIDWKFELIDDNNKEILDMFKPHEEYTILIAKVVSKKEINVAFNKLTSEVHYIGITDYENLDWWASNNFIYKIIDKFNTIKELKDDTSKFTDLEKMVDMIGSLVGKEPDEFLPIDMDTDMLAAVDAEAAKLGITRNDFLTKVVLNFVDGN